MNRPTCDRPRKERAPAADPDRRGPMRIGVIYMIIYPEEQYRTPEEQRRLEEITQKDNELEARMIELGESLYTVELDEAGFENRCNEMSKITAEQVKLRKEEREIKDVYRQKYIEAFSGDESFILQAAQNRLDHIGKEDFQTESKERLTRFKMLRDIRIKQAEDEEEAEEVRHYFDYEIIPMYTETYTGARAYCRAVVRLEVEALKRFELDRGPLDAIIDDLLTEWGYIIDEDPLFDRDTGRLQLPEEQPAETPQNTHIIVKRAQIIEYPLDKPNSVIWNLLDKDTAGQIAINLAKRGSGQALDAYYAINFDELGDDVTITKRLLPFDKRIYIAISGLFNTGNNVISLSQIYYAAGYTGRPGTKDLTKINESITKMTQARIFFDNKEEADKYKYPRFMYDGSLLPLERCAATINGQLTDAAIHIFREPPLITYAKQRGQITTVGVKLLQSPVSKTDANLLIDDYLIERISKAKNGKGHSGRVLFKTLYEHTGIASKPKTNTEKQQKKRAPEKIKKYLTHYQKVGFITRFTMEADGVTVYW